MCSIMKISFLFIYTYLLLWFLWLVILISRTVCDDMSFFVAFKAHRFLSSVRNDTPVASNAQRSRYVCCYFHEHVMLASMNVFVHHRFNGFDSYTVWCQSCGNGFIRDAITQSGDINPDERETDLNSTGFPWMKKSWIGKACHCRAWSKVTLYRSGEICTTTSMMQDNSLAFNRLITSLAPFLGRGQSGCKMISSVIDA